MRYKHCLSCLQDVVRLMFAKQIVAVPENCLACQFLIANTKLLACDNSTSQPIIYMSSTAKQ